jgi:hypothetical protein
MKAHKSLTPVPANENRLMSAKNILSEHELYLIRETAKLTENLYVKIVCDNLAMQKVLRLM